MARRFILLAACCLCLQWAAGHEIVFSPELGCYLENGKPTLLIGPADHSSIYQRWYVWQRDRDCPPELDWIYNEIPTHDSLTRMGFNTYSTTPTGTMTRVFSPDYRSYDAEDPVKGNCRFIDSFKGKPFYKSVRWMAYLTRGDDMYPKGFAEYREFLRTVDYPVYIDYHNLAYLFRNPEWFSEFFADGAAAFNPDAGNSAFTLGFSLACPSGREAYLKTWKHAAEEVYRSGVNGAYFEFFNEPKYFEYTPNSRKNFALWLEKRYGTVAEMNRVWRTRYPSFAEPAAAFTPNGANPRGLKIDWTKFSCDAVQELLREGRETVRSVDPSIKTGVQRLGGGSIRSLWDNFNFYDNTTLLDLVLTGTGGSAYINAEAKEPGAPFGVNDNTMLHDDLINPQLCLALAAGKPVINNETYIGRSYDSLHGTLWSEMIRGRNVVYLFWWRKWDPKYTQEEDARRASYHLLNRKTFDPSGWKAITDFRKELETAGEFFLPRVRRAKSETAVLFSWPSRRMESARNTEKTVDDGYGTAALGLTFAHYPYDAIYEEQLAERAKNYRAIIVNGVHSVAPESLKALKKFVAGGGILIAGLDLPLSDEYGHALAGDLFGLTVKRQPETGGSQELQLGQRAIKVIPSVSIGKRQGWSTELSLGSRPVLLSRREGKGRVYFAAFRTNDYGFAAFAEWLLRKNGVEPAGRLLNEAGTDLEADVELLRADHEGVIAWYLMNTSSYPKLVRLEYAGSETAAAIEIYDRKRSLPRGGSGFTLLLPPQRRTVLFSGAPETLQAKFGDFAPIGVEELRGLAEALLIQKRAAGPEIPGAPLDLTTFCNYGFTNPQSFSPDTVAWFEGNERGLQETPWEPVRLQGVSCRLIRWDFNQNRTTIALQSRHLPDAPAEVKGIPVNAKLRAVSFFHAVTHAVNGSRAMTYRVHYADGQTVELPMTVGNEIGSWKLDANPPEAKKRIAWRNSAGRGFFRYEWINPEPQNEILSIDVAGGTPGLESTPLTTAITVHEAPPPRTAVPVPKEWVLASGAWNGELAAKGNSTVSLRSPDRAPLAIPKEKFRSGRLSFEVNAGQDEWGVYRSLRNVYCRIHGLKDGKSYPTAGPGRNASAAFLNRLPIDTDPETWQEVVIPLDILATAEQGVTLDNAFQIDFIRYNDAPANVPLFIRNIRFEYE